MDNIGNVNIGNKVVAVTGAGSGIGRAIALELATHGARLVLSGRTAAPLEELAAEITTLGGDAIVAIADVGSRDDVLALVQAALDRHGRLDTIVSNAGVAPISPLADLRVDDWDAMVDVNVKGALNVIAAALPVFLRQQRGHFVFTVSTAGLVVSPTMAIYAATKNFVRTLAEGLRVESEGRYRVTSISPGFVATNLVQSMTDPKVRDAIKAQMDEIALDPADVARAVGFAIAQPDHVDIGDVVIRPSVQT
ncbi:SDR family oxidoreductase [Phyllobacterium sp. K27]